MLPCCKITGFPQCFLLFVRVCHGNLEPVHVRDSGLSCKAPHSGIHDVSCSRAKAFLRLLSDSSTQEPHCGRWRNYCQDTEGKRIKKKFDYGTYDIKSSQSFRSSFPSFFFSFFLCECKSPNRTEMLNKTPEQQALDCFHSRKNLWFFSMTVLEIILILDWNKT